MAEEPEQVLPEHRIAAAGGVEERPVERALQLQQQSGEDDGRKGDQDHTREDQHRPGEQGHSGERHARRAGLENADQYLDRTGNGADFDEADAEQPEVGVDTGRISGAGQRRVHEPAAIGSEAHEDRAEEAQSADKIGPEGIGRQSRERQVAGGEHLRQQHDPDRLHHGNREQEHHHRAVHREELVVSLLWQNPEQRERQLGPDDQRQNAGKQEEQKGGGNVPQPDIIIIDDGQPAPATRGRPDALEIINLALRTRFRSRKAIV